MILGGQFELEIRGQFKLERGGQFRLEEGGQLAADFPTNLLHLFLRLVKQNHLLRSNLTASVNTKQPIH